MLGKYSILLLHREYPYIIVRNWLFVGIPYFSIGMWLNDKKPLVHKLFDINGKLKLSVMICAFSLTTLLERYMLVSHGLNAKRDHYISTTVLAVAVFLIFVLFISKEETIVSRIGKKDSTWIYVLHPIFIVVLGHIVRWAGIGEYYAYLQPIVVFVVTAAFVVTIRSLRSKFNSGR